MFLITDVTIAGFWGEYTASTHLDKDVNIFIGKNGTGKTTFINLILAALTVDLRILASNEFSSITMNLSDGPRKRKIFITKDILADAPYDLITFVIGQRKFRIPTYLNSSQQPRLPRSKIYNPPGLMDTKKAISELVNVSSLSVHRYEAYDESSDDADDRSGNVKTPVDIRLRLLMAGLTSYQLSLSAAANAVSSRFQKEVLASMLYDERFDVFRLEPETWTKANDLENQLLRAFSELGVKDDQIKQRIENHADKIRKSIQAFSVRTGTQNLLLDDFLPWPLFKRTQHVIELSLKAEADKNEIFTPIVSYIDLLNDYFTDKKFAVNRQTGELFSEKAGKKVPVFQLSSGEKQLLIFLTETLLQKDQPYIFFADEPELSMHIEWQAKLISSMKKLNHHSQIIVATHSPEIAGRWKKNVVPMHKVVTQTRQNETNDSIIHKKDE
jgi:energy-coupling factor transporter ATP-binding protein EcfA2